MVVRSSVQLSRTVTIPVRSQIRRTRSSHRRSTIATEDWRPAGTGFLGARSERSQRRRHATLSELRGRFADDRDLIRVKLVLLAGLIALTAVLERAV